MSAPSMKSATLLITTPLLTQERVLRALRRAASALEVTGPVQPGDLAGAAPTLDAAQVRALLEAMTEIGWALRCGDGFRPVDTYPEDPAEPGLALTLAALRRAGAGLPAPMGVWLAALPGDPEDARRAALLVAWGHVRCADDLYLPERP